MTEQGPSIPKELSTQASKEEFVRSHLWEILNNPGISGFGVSEASEARLILRDVKAASARGRNQTLGSIAITSGDDLEEFKGKDKLRFAFYGRDGNTWNFTVDENNNMSNFNGINGEDTIKAVTSLVWEILYNVDEKKHIPILRVQAFYVSDERGETELEELSGWWKTQINTGIFLSNQEYVYDFSYAQERLGRLRRSRRRVNQRPALQNPK